MHWIQIPYTSYTNNSNNATQKTYPNKFLGNGCENVGDARQILLFNVVVSLFFFSSSHHQNAPLHNGVDVSAECTHNCVWVKMFSLRREMKKIIIIEEGTRHIHKARVGHLLDRSFASWLAVSSQSEYRKFIKCGSTSSLLIVHLMCTCIFLYEPFFLMPCNKENSLHLRARDSHIVDTDFMSIRMYAVLGVANSFPFSFSNLSFHMNLLVSACVAFTFINMIWLPLV